MSNALEGIEKLREYADTVIVISNDNLLKIVDRKTTMPDALKKADEVLQQAVQGITDLITQPALVNLDFADVSTVMKDAGRAHMGVGTASGREKAEQAALAAVASPLLETSINGATGVLVNVTGSSELTLDDVETAAGIVQEAANPEANIIFGATWDETFQDEMRVTVIATGFEARQQETESAEPTAKKPAFAVDSDDEDIFNIFKR
jgi:cell division protein FtsZ